MHIPAGLGISNPLAQQQAIQNAQMGKMATLQMQQHHPAMSIATQLPQFSGLPTISMAGGTGLTLAGAGMYHGISPALSPLGHMPAGLQGLGLAPTILTSTYGGVNNSIPKMLMPSIKDGSLLTINGFAVPAKLTEKRKIIEEIALNDVKKAKLETKALKAKRPGFTDDRYNETSYYVENGLRKVYPYYFTFTTFTKGRWVGEKILDVFAREFRAHPVEEYERCILDGTLTVNYDQVDTDYRLRHNDLLANIVHRLVKPSLVSPDNY
jgi:hypothetical protein